MNYNKMNEYLANLAVLNVKFHNLHWNVEGKQFVQLHEFTEAMYDSFFEQFDEVAELMKMRGIYPLATLTDYLKATTIDELASKKFSADELLTIVKNDLNVMKDCAVSIRNDADENNDFVVVAAFEGYVASFQKNLWFIDALCG